MKIRHPWLIRLASFLGVWVLRLWMGTLHHLYRSIGPDVDPRNRHLRQRCIYAGWHEYALLPLYLSAGTPTSMLVSQHADGESIAQVCRYLRLPTIRGSATRGGIEAVRRLLRASRAGHLGVTSDGPRGPRRRLKPGVIYLAARTGLPIVPMGFGLDRPWRLRSWDRFAIPRPWSRAAVVPGLPIWVPDLALDELEPYRQRVEAAVAAVTEMAERWAATGTFRVEKGTQLFAELHVPTCKTDQSHQSHQAGGEDRAADEAA
jgi:lysophospholipid acyltransferase (LPLAT)-like uncharacterized protein